MTGTGGTSLPEFEVGDANANRPLIDFVMFLNINHQIAYITLQCIKM